MTARRLKPQPDPKAALAPPDAPAEDMARLLPWSEVCERLGLTVAELAKLHLLGRLPGFEHHRRVLVKRRVDHVELRWAAELVEAFAQRYGTTGNGARLIPPTPEPLHGNFETSLAAVAATLVRMFKAEPSATPETMAFGDVAALLGLDRAGLLRLYANGSLPGIHTRPCISSQQTLLFSARDVRKLIATAVDLALNPLPGARPQRRRPLTLGERIRAEIEAESRPR